MIKSFLNKKSRSEPNIDVTAFMSLMIVLIPVLLINIQFELFAQYDIYTKPNQTVVNNINSKTKPLILIIDSNAVTLTQGDKKLLSVSNKDKELLKPKLSDAFNKLTTKSNITVKIKTKYIYQDMVNLMDFVNQFKDKFNSVDVKVDKGRNHD
jgi:biopolymer transport protein ExbD